MGWRRAKDISKLHEQEAQILWPSTTVASLSPSLWTTGRSLITKQQRFTDGAAQYMGTNWKRASATLQLHSGEALKDSEDRVSGSAWLFSLCERRSSSRLKHIKIHGQWQQKDVDRCMGVSQKCEDLCVACKHTSENIPHGRGMEGPHSQNYLAIWY